MNRVTRALLTALLAISIGLVTRIAFVGQNDFDSTDLARYEGQPYGVDLPDWYGDYPFLLAWTRGDGQAFVTIAADPFAQEATLGLSTPTYRLSRVGYSVIARGLVGWRKNLIPVGLLATNLMAMGALGFIAGWKAPEWGPRAFLLPLNPSALIGVTADTAEVLGVLLIAVTIMSRRRWISVGTGALLGVTRPSYATAIPAGAQGWWSAAAALSAGVTFQLWLVMVNGLEWTGSAGNLTLPLIGYIRAWPEITGAARLACAAVVAGALASMISGLATSGSRRAVALVATGVLVLSLAPGVVSEPVNLFRAIGALPVLWIIPPLAPKKG